MLFNPDLVVQDQVRCRAKILVCCVTKCAPHKALKSIVSGKLTVDERVVVHCVSRHCSGNHMLFNPDLVVQDQVCFHAIQVDF